MSGRSQWCLKVPQRYSLRYMGEKSKAAGNRSQLKRAMLGIAAATCSNKKHGLHLQHGKLYFGTLQFMGSLRSCSAWLL